MMLPPSPAARTGGDIVAAMLDKVDIKVKVENLEGARWLSGVHKGQACDLTQIAHGQPLDFGNFAGPDNCGASSRRRSTRCGPGFRPSTTASSATGGWPMRSAWWPTARWPACLYRPTSFTVADARTAHNPRPH